MSNYIEREVKRRAFVVQRWDFREKEKMEIEAENKKKAGVGSFLFKCRQFLSVSLYEQKSETCQILYFDVYHFGKGFRNLIFLFIF